MGKNETQRELERLRERYAAPAATVLRIGGGLAFGPVLQEVANGARALVKARCGIVVTDVGARHARNVGDANISLFPCLHGL